MSLYSQRPTFATVLRSFGSHDGLPFPDVLTEDDIRQACDDEGVAFARGEGDVYTPAVTLWAFLAQCLSASKSCVAAVARVLVLRVALGLPPCAAGSGAYCKARAKLPETLLRRLALHVGTAVEKQAPDAWRWRGRRVLLTDGCELSLSDTPANQKRYPQLKSQKPGLGFPRLRLVVLLAYATACLVGAAMGPCKGKGGSETELFRSLLERIETGDLIVADRYYCTWWLVALLQQRGADVCFRLHQLRHYDFTKGQCLGKGDHVARWPKPARPPWMDVATYRALPEALSVREVEVVVEEPGYRVKRLVVATTLTEAGCYSQKDIGDLYHRRWHVEIHQAGYRSSSRLYLGGVAA